MAVAITRARGFRWAAIALTVIVTIVLAYLLWSSWNQAAVMSWLRQARPIPFFVVMALLPAIGVPLTPLVVLAGATFGARIGLVGTWFAIAGNAALCYWIARSGLRPTIISILRRLRYELPDFQKNENRSPIRFTLIVKLMPGLPSFAKNYALGIANVPFALYLGAVVLISGLYATAFVVLGESLLSHDLRRTAIAGGCLLVVAVAVWVWRRRARRAVDRGGKAPSGR